jgi:endonuclease/exonuclease/phosphatase family metal-dependent hydrolase
VVQWKLEALKSLATGPMFVEEQQADRPVEALYRMIREELAPHFPRLARHGSTAELLGDPLYRVLEQRIRAVLEFPETGDFTSAAAPARPRYRLVAWNLERGIQFEGQLEALRSHPSLAGADVLLLTETDVGMARSGNRAVAQELARELKMHFAFAPCYLNLSKGAGLELHVDGDNDLGLHGNAILSRYPLRNVRPISLRNGRDKMRGREKRLGRQTALVAEVVFPNYHLEVVSVHLDAQSSQRHRREQMRDVVNALQGPGPVVLGGDWNTTTYNSSSALRAIIGFWLRVFMGPGNVIRNHYLHPYRRFERDLFAMLEARGFDYRRCNVAGERTTSYDVEDVKTNKNLREWVPAWCFAFIRWALRNHNGQCPLKIDWFASRKVKCENPEVVHELREGRPVPLSDHDAIAVEVVV